VHAITEELGAANQRDAGVEGPDHHKVVATRHAQPCADGAFTPFEFPDNFRRLTNHLCLDDGPVGRLNQDHVAELKPLDINLDRHRRRV